MTPVACTVTVAPFVTVAPLPSFKMLNAVPLQPGAGVDIDDVWDEATQGGVGASLESLSQT